MDVVKLGKIERMGVLFTFVLGGLLKLSFVWSGGAVWSILFGAVNDSIWENLKVFALPYLLWSVFELMMVRASIRRMVVSKFIGVAAFSACFIGLSYLCRLLFGGISAIALIIVSFVLIGLCHLLSFVLLTGKARLERWFCVSAFCMVLFFVMFLTFTLHPPKSDLFYDGVQGLYGMPGITQTIAEGNVFAAVR